MQQSIFDEQSLRILDDDEVAIVFLGTGTLIAAFFITYQEIVYSNPENRKDIPDKECLSLISCHIRHILKPGDQNCPRDTNQRVYRWQLSEKQPPFFSDPFLNSWQRMLSPADNW